MASGIMRQALETGLAHDDICLHVIRVGYVLEKDMLLYNLHI